MKRADHRGTGEPAGPGVFPPSVNYHVLSACNMRCEFCFAGFSDLGDQATVTRGLPAGDACRLVELLGGEFEKITFAGGEPTLYSALSALLKCARSVGLVTMLVTNGSRLIQDEGHLCEVLPWLNWVALSIDSAAQDTHRRLGRTIAGRAYAAEEYLSRSQRLRGRGVRLKLNTVVSSQNADEDMSSFVSLMRPERWKILQALPVNGQNNSRIARLQVDLDRFDAYVRRHSHLQENGIAVVAERNEDITGSYAMVSPDGRFFDNVDHRHVYGDRILDVGVRTAWSRTRFDHRRFDRRGGRYAWGRGSVTNSSGLALNMPGREVSGKKTRSVAL